MKTLSIPTGVLVSGKKMWYHLRMKRPDLVARNTKHGLSRVHKSEYRTWKDMRARCNNPNNTDYYNYGARGIMVCQRWDDFALFYDDMGNRPIGFTLDRINPLGNYEPTNCRWANASTQANNKRTNRRISHNGEERTLLQWCRLFNLDHSRVRYRLAQGWPTEKAFSKEDFRK